MECSKARELFVELFKKRDFERIGRLFSELKGKKRKCFESGALELTGEELQKVRQKLIETLSATEGRERGLSPQLIEKVLTEARNTHLVKSVCRKGKKEYGIFSLIVRFRDGKQRTIRTKSTKEEKRAYELYGLLKTYILNAVNTH